MNHFALICEVCKLLLLVDCLKLFLNWAVRACFSSSSVITSSFICMNAKRRAGTHLTNNPHTRDIAPAKMQNRCCYWVSPTQRTGRPPSSTRVTWITIVSATTKRKSQLLKKPLKMLNSRSPSFRALISLKTCIITKVWKTIVKWVSFCKLSTLSPVVG